MQETNAQSQSDEDVNETEEIKSILRKIGYSDKAIEEIIKWYA